MKIRKARERDLKEFVDLRKKTFREFKFRKIENEEKNIKREFPNFLKSSKKLFLVANEEGNIVGYLIATFLSNVWQKSVYLDDIFVEKRFRRKMMASNLMKELIKNAKQKKIKKIKLGVDIKNKKAISFYKWFGFNTKYYELEKKLK